MANTSVEVIITHNMKGKGEQMNNMKERMEVNGTGGG